MKDKTAVVQKRKGLSKVFKRELLSVLMLAFVMVLTINFLSVAAFATPATGTEQLGKVIEWIANWAGRIGLAVAFFGALQVALGFMQDDADAKVRGLKTMAAGFMVYGVCEVYDKLFITSGGDVPTT